KMPLMRIARWWAVALFLHGVYGIIQIVHNDQVVSALGNRNFYGGFILSGLPFIFFFIGHSIHKK
ncbi:hypothetical protein KDK77_09845, partial [bacterium]|nr:hypothetical protein [bacterium]